MARTGVTAAARTATARSAPARTKGDRAAAPNPRPRARRAEPRRGSAARHAPVSARSRARGVLDALLYGRAWIALVGVLLAGIVFFNVDLLQMNRDIAVTSKRVAEVKRENARLRLELARLVSSERIQEAAAARGLVLPAPGEVRYLRADPTVDARRAASRLGKRDKGSPTG
jgi:cell division protein FtsL